MFRKRESIDCKFKQFTKAYVYIESHIKLLNT